MPRYHDIQKKHHKSFTNCPFRSTFIRYFVKEVLLFFIVSYLNSKKVQVSKFVTLSWHSQKALEITKNDQMSN